MSITSNSESVPFINLKENKFEIINYIIAWKEFSQSFIQRKLYPVLKAQLLAFHVSILYFKGSFK
jgi:hypothetical protein